MNDLFQFFPGSLLVWLRAKNQPADLSTIDFSPRTKNAFAKGLAETILDAWFGKDLVARSVSFDDFDGMFLMQQPGKMALAATNATDQTDHRDSSRGI